MFSNVPLMLSSISNVFILHNLIQQLLIYNHHNGVVTEINKVLTHAATIKILPTINAHLIKICRHRSAWKHQIQTTKEGA